MPVPFIFPKEALDDICRVVGLSHDELEKLVAIFSRKEAAFPFRTGFIHQVAEALGVGTDDARIAVVVCEYVLIRPTQDEDTDIDEHLQGLRLYLDEHLEDEDKLEILNQFDAIQPSLASLCKPKPEPVRAKKTYQLAHGPEPRITSFRTVSQLRPLFEGDDEEIVGLVPVILLEVGSEDNDEDATTHIFGMDESDLLELEKVVKRAKDKLEAIRVRYPDEILTAD